MKLKLNKLKVVFAILFGTLLSISPLNPVLIADTEATLEVCAQDIGYQEIGTGVSCIPNYSSCPGGHNLMELLEGVRYHDSINATKLKESLEKAYGPLHTGLCVSEDINSIIVRWMTGSELTGSGICENATAGSSCQNIPSIGEAVGTLATLISVPRYCPTGWVGQVGPNKLNLFAGSVSGCCPTTHTFVNVAGQATAEAVQSGICCKRPADGRVPSVYMYEGGPQGIGCYTMDNDLIYSADLSQQAQGSYSTLEEALRAAEDANMIVGIDTANGQFTPAVHPTNTGGTVIKPQFGLGFGLGFPGAQMSIATNRVAPARCPAASDCYLSKDRNSGNYVPGAVLENGQNVFEDPNKVALQCEKCFNEGEPISVDPNTNTMYVCDTSETSKRRPVPLCNASVIDTVACLGGATSTSQNANNLGIESTNYDLCCQCREQGGVWTGIGCTDTTPSGLITGLIRIVYGVMGGVALVMLIYAGIMYQTGNEANVKKARETIIQTVTGLIVLTFSILILRIIGINVLDILPTGSV